MLNTTQTGNIGWNFLRKNSEYNEEWLFSFPSTSAKMENSPFDLYKQERFDQSAQKWGLFAYADPTISPGSVTPFWSITPTLEAGIAPEDKQALLPMLRKVGAVISGLLLLNGDLILKIKRDEATVQVHIKDGRSFNETSGLTLHLPLDLALPIRLKRSLDLWNFTTGQQTKKVIITI